MLYFQVCILEICFRILNLAQIDKNISIIYTLYSISECTDKGGSPKGKCAAGFGICCVFTLRGDDSTQEVNNNDTYIQNPGFPTVYTDTSSLSYTVNKCQDGKYLENRYFSCHCHLK